MNNWNKQEINVERIMDLFVCDVTIEICDFFTDTVYLSIDCDPQFMDFWSTKTGEVWENDSTFLKRVLASPVGEVKPGKDKLIVRVFIDDLEPFLR